MDKLMRLSTFCSVSARLRFVPAVFCAIVSGLRDTARRNVTLISSHSRHNIIVMTHQLTLSMRSVIVQ
uniref:Putative secreted protein n=1 Tax=Ixodes ricinus TaxID=34613 RepID=A0A147BLT3_IXORI